MLTLAIQETDKKRMALMKSLDRINTIYECYAIYYAVDGLGGTGLAHEVEK